MSQSNFELKASEINSITNATSPVVPVENMIQESEDVFVWCQVDKDMLIRAGLDWHFVDELPIRAGALRYIQSRWQKEYLSVEDAQRLWKNESHDAYGLRDEIVHHYLHAFRKMPNEHAQTQRIAEGSGHADMIQDLANLAMLGKDNAQVLAAVGFDLALLDLAESKSSQLANLLAQSNGERMSTSELKTTRDKAYAYLKQAVDEVRHHGQYVFWRNEDRLKGYVSKYHKLRNRKNKSKDEQE